MGIHGQFQIPVDVTELFRTLASPEATVVISVGILLVGMIVAYGFLRWTVRFLRRRGLDSAVEGTPLERSLRRLGTSTIGLIGLLVALFVYLLTVLLALNVAQLVNFQMFWARLTGYLPRLFVAALAVIVGLVVGDKAGLIVSERLRSVKLPEASFLPELVKYSIFYVAALIALAQLGVTVGALLVLLAAYAFGLVFLGGLAFRDLLAASAAGIFLLLAEPYAIGDEIRIDDRRGIVQEVDVFVTHIEADGEEYIVPNQEVFRSGVVRIRD
jgi:small-conductance mechanosensitive channel